jgi:hypothetical protein
MKQLLDATMRVQILENDSYIDALKCLLQEKRTTKVRCNRALFLLENENKTAKTPSLVQYLTNRVPTSTKKVETDARR